MIVLGRQIDVRKPGEGLHQIVGHVAIVRGGIRARSQKNKQERDGKRPHDAVTPSKPSCVADGGGLPPRRSTSLYHAINAAAVTITAMPTKLTKICIAIRLETSVSTKWAEKERKTPRQKISSECWPHKISGRAQFERRNFASKGTKRMTRIAMARKWKSRQPESPVLSSGRIISQPGRRPVIPGNSQLNCSGAASAR